MNTMVRTKAHYCDLENQREGTVPVKIKTGDYTGIFYVDKTGPHPTQKRPHDSLLTLYLSPGNHQIKFFWFFFFDVNENGSVTNISNPMAAYSEDGMLVFRTSKISFDLGDYGANGGALEILSYPIHLGFPRIDVGPDGTVPEVVVVTGITHGLDTGANMGPPKEKKQIKKKTNKHAGSYLPFFIRENGSVWSDSSAVTGSKNCLHLNSGVARIIPPVPGLEFRVGCNRRVYAGTSDVPVIFGLRTSILIRKQTINGFTFTEGIGYFSPEYAPEYVEVPFYAGNAPFTWQIPRDDVPANR